MVLETLCDVSRVCASVFQGIPIDFFLLGQYSSVISLPRRPPSCPLAGATAFADQQMQRSTQRIIYCHYLPTHANLCRLLWTCSGTTVDLMPKTLRRVFFNLNSTNGP